MKIDVSINDGSDYTVTVLLAGKESVRFEVKSIDGTQAVGWAAGNLVEGDPEWLKNDYGAVILAHMRDNPGDKVSINAAALLEESDFPATRYAKMFRAIRALMLKQEKVTPTSISQEAFDIDPSLAVPAWFADSVGGDSDDVDASSCLNWLLSQRIHSEKQVNSCSN